MTEPAVASSDATNIALSIDRDGDEYVLNGRKWWTTGGVRERCRIPSSWCALARTRVTFGQPISERANVQDWIAESRTAIEMARLRPHGGRDRRPDA
jgi:alkylation response protein AidB-like acyl-CoA dehydrogenase